MEKKEVFFNKLTFLLLFAFLMGMGTEYFFVKIAHSSRSVPKHELMEVRKTFGYPLINRLLECDAFQDVPYNDKIVLLKKTVEKTITRDKESNWISSASVYFRDLDNGFWLSVGPTKEFKPASLMKVPIMIALLREAEGNPGLMARKVKFSVPKELDTLQRIKPPVQMEQGKYYTVDELLLRMIAYSDNDATYLLEDVVNPAIREEVFADMNVESPYKNPNKEFYVSAEEYASFFRILYNASYLSKEMSEKALEYMVQSSFRSGIVAGLPANIVVAHKFGERTDENDSNLKFLSDCGIVYYPGHPYLLCVLTKGPIFETLDDAIQDISGTIYAGVSSR